MFGLYVIVAVCLIICPIVSATIITAVIMNKGLFHGQYWGYMLFSLAGLALLYIGYQIGDPVIPLMICKGYIGTVFPFIGWHTDHVGLKSWIMSDLRTIGSSITVTMLSLYFATRTPERIMMDEERRREQAKLHVQPIDYIPKRSQLIVGVSGAGKSAYIGKTIEEILRKDPDAFIVVVDGKGSTEKYSLHYSSKIIAEKTEKGLYVLNGTNNDALDGIVYDFLDEVENSDAMKDMIMALEDDPTIKASAGSEHYRVMTERYLLEIIELMLYGGIDVTLYNSMKISDPFDLENALEYMNIDADKKTAVLKFAQENWPDVKANVEKIKMFLRGQGSKIFMGSGKRTNIRKAYREGAIVLVLADQMSMPSLASKLVQLVTMDIRNLVAGRLTGRIDMNRKVYVIYDEFSSYASSIPLVKSLYARARSADTILSLATQSCSDLIALGDGWFDTIVDTADRFVVFRQNSGEATEAAATIFGTEIHVTGTARSSEMQTTGEASNTVDRSFIVSPDLIRNLKVNHGFLLDKAKKEGHQLKYFRNRFVKEGK